MNEVIIIGTADYRPDPRNPVFVSDRFLKSFTLCMMTFNEKD